jgi:hypothetical protein
MIPRLHPARKRKQTTKDLKHTFFDLLTIKRKAKTYVSDTNLTVYTTGEKGGIFLSLLPALSYARVYGSVILLFSPTTIPLRVRSQPGGSFPGGPFC